MPEWLPCWSTRVSLWLQEDCDAEPGNGYKTETSGASFASWILHASRAEKSGSQKGFAAEMQKRDFVSDRVTGGKRIFRGVRLPVERHPE